MMKKICYVVTVPVTIRAFFIPQLQYLVDNGFDVSVICSNDDSLQEELGKRIHYFPVYMPRGISFKASLSAIRKLIKIFRKEKFDLVQYSTPNAALYASIASKMVGVKVRNYHLMGYRYLGAKGIGRSILKIIEKVTCMLSTNIECVSKSNMKIGIEQKLFTQSKATVVWNGSTGGVDTNRFDCNKREQWRNEIREELGYQDSDFVYGFVGRITRDKGINELLTAFKRLNTHDHLLLVGNIEEENTLDKGLLEYANNQDNICFHLQVSDIERYYAAIDVLVLPSYREGFGNVVIEAGAMGTPAIVSKIPGPVDTIQKDKTAYTFAVKNVQELVEVMKKIRTSDTKEMGENAKRYVARHFESEILNKKILLRKRNLLNIGANYYEE